MLEPRPRRTPHAGRRHPRSDSGIALRRLSAWSSVIQPPVLVFGVPLVPAPGFASAGSPPWTRPVPITVAPIHPVTISWSFFLIERPPRSPSPPSRRPTVVPAPDGLLRPFETRLCRVSVHFPAVVGSMYKFLCGACSLLTRSGPKSRGARHLKIVKQSRA